MNGITIDRKILFSSLVTLLLFIGMSIYAIYSSNRIADLKATENEFTKDATFYHQVELDHTNWGVKVANSVGDSDTHLGVEIDHTKCKFGKMILQAKADNNLTERAMNLIHKIDPFHEKLHDLGGQVDVLLKKGKFSEAKLLFKSDYKKYSTPIFSNLHPLVAYYENKSQKLNKQTTSYIGEMKMVWVTISIIMLIGILASMYFNIKPLKNLAKKLISSVTEITTVSNQISNGSRDLSVRTEEQASSLEEMAATVEEITSAVKLTAENSHKASDLSKEAVEKAQGGIKTSSEVQGAMKGISESSKKISNIVNLVDEISFQTNILAVNAAIEAAKAGEQGKGFAVVAIEVRDLAQRSAEAAKDIKVLIESSLQEVEQGTILVGENDHKLVDMLSSVSEVASLMGEVSGATKEQYTAIEQINKAVSELDSVTQQNASMVEELATSSQQMLSQSQNMDILVRSNLSIDRNNIDSFNGDTPVSLNTNEHAVDNILANAKKFEGGEDF